MKVYIKFITSVFFRSLFFVFSIMISLVFILNLLSELEFFKNENISIGFTIFLSLINSPSQIFEMFPFIMLITIQLFFIKFFEYKEIEIFKYSGLKNSKIIIILGSLSFITGILVILIFYNLSSNLKNIYLELKSNYTNDGKYLAVVTKNGLWIKDKVDEKIIITNSSSIDGKYLVKNFITEFDENYNVIRNIQSNEIDISKKEWKILKPTIYKQNNYEDKDIVYLNTNFNSERIQTLYSNLSSLNLYELYELKKNYVKLNYSITDVNLHLLKLISNPIYLLLITIFSALIMLNIKQVKSSTFKISIGLFFSVIIYYLNNFSYILGSTERISLLLSIFLPLVILGTINALLLYKVNVK
ncbi:LptF/LptG family permease [Candidatus Pelagibacter communis]|uniref:LptF/LptG family permease n=1 Tax=Pelagibacter ubique TaxID=198252 RepID=UPI00094D2FE7|nr:LptF/LptG family permease [Candidatus Pelagibacter ubique]